MENGFRVRVKGWEGRIEAYKGDDDTVESNAKEHGISNGSRD